MKHLLVVIFFYASLVTSYAQNQDSVLISELQEKVDHFSNEINRIKTDNLLIDWRVALGIIPLSLTLLYFLLQYFLAKMHIPFQTDPPLPFKLTPQFR